MTRRRIDDPVTDSPCRALPVRPRIGVAWLGLWVLLLSVAATIGLSSSTASASGEVVGLVMRCDDAGWLRFQAVNNGATEATISFANTGLDPSTTPNEVKSAFPLVIPPNSLGAVNWSIPSTVHVAPGQWDLGQATTYAGPYGYPARFVPTDSSGAPLTAPPDVKDCGEFPPATEAAEPRRLWVTLLYCQAEPDELDASEAYLEDAYLTSGGRECERPMQGTRLAVRDVTDPDASSYPEPGPNPYDLGAIDIGNDGRGYLHGVAEDHQFQIRIQPGDETAWQLATDPTVVQDLDCVGGNCYAAVVSLPVPPLEIEFRDSRAPSQPLVGGACYAVDGPSLVDPEPVGTLPEYPGDYQGEVCDNNDEALYSAEEGEDYPRLLDADPRDGAVRVDGLFAGTYTVRKNGPDSFATTTPNPQATLLQVGQVARLIFGGYESDWGFYVEKVNCMRDFGYYPRHLGVIGAPVGCESAEHGVVFQASDDQNPSDVFGEFTTDENGRFPVSVPVGIERVRLTEIVPPGDPFAPRPGDQDFDVVDCFCGTGPQFTTIVDVLDPNAEFDQGTIPDVAGCTYTPANPPPGSTMVADCEDFEPGEYVTFALSSDDTTGFSVAAGFSADGPEQASVPGALLMVDKADVDGKLLTRIPIPETTQGTYRIQTDGQTSSRYDGAAVAISAKVTVPTPARVGQQVTITVQGFGASETVALRWDAEASAPVPIGTVTTDAGGRATLAYTIPAAVGGAHVVDATGASSGLVASVAVTIEPRIAVPSVNQEVGSSVAVELSGFSANQLVELRWDADPAPAGLLATVTTDANGSAATVIVVPEATKGSHAIAAVTGAGTTSLPMTVLSDVTSSPSGGVVGTMLELRATGLLANQPVTFKWYATTSTTSSSTILGTATAGALGTATLSTAIPIGTALGLHAVEAFQSGSVRPTVSVAAWGCDVTPQPAAANVALTVKCAGFTSGEAVQLAWQTAGGTVLSTKAAPSTGQVTFTSVRVPDSPAGTYTLVATGLTSGYSTQTPITVATGLALSSTSGYAASTTTATARGFAVGETVTFRWDADGATPTDYATVAANAAGTAVAPTFTVPARPAGSYRIRATGATSGATASAAYAVGSRVRLSTGSGPVGTTVTATLEGFAAGEVVTLRWYDTASSSTVLAQLTADAAGGVTHAFPAPAATKGSHKVEATGLTTGAKSATFSVSALVALSPTSGTAGTQLSVAMTGFGASEAVAVRWYTTATAFAVVTTVTSDAVGSATASFAVPTGTSGGHKVEGSSPAATASATFTVFGCATTATTAIPGSSVNLTCSDFTPGESVTMRWETVTGTVISTKVANSSGVATFSGTAIPDAVSGPHTLVAVGATSGKVSETPITVVPGVVLSYAYGNVGRALTVTLRGYPAGEVVPVRWDALGGSPVTIATLTTGATGAASTPYTVPATPRGTYQVDGVGTTTPGASAAAAFRVDPKFALSDTSTTVGASVTATLTGYAANEVVALKWYDTTTSATTLTTLTTTASGDGTHAFTVPEATKGSHKLEAAAAATPLDSVTVTVSPSTALAATAGPVGTSVGVTLRGYAANETVAVRWYDTTSTYTQQTMVTTSALGSASATITVPDATAGSHKIEGASTTVTTTKSSATFVVQPRIALSPASAALSGGTVAVTITGYAATEVVTLKWSPAGGGTQTTLTTTPATVTTSSKGLATASFVVPGAAAGSYQVVGSGNKASSATAPFQLGSSSAGFRRAGPTATPAPTVTPERTATRTAATPIVDRRMADGFDVPGRKGLPKQWDLWPVGSDGVVVGTAGGEVTMAGEPGWLVRRNRVYTAPDLRATLRFDAPGGRAGLLLAWNGPDDWVAVVADEAGDRLVVMETSDGVGSIVDASEPGSVPIEPGASYVLRVQAGTGRGEGIFLNLLWSVDGGVTFTEVGSVTDLPATGGVGLLNDGATVAFADVAARRSKATEPIQESTPTNTPEATDTPEPTATSVAPTPGMEEPVVEEPTETPSPSSTPVPPPTESPQPTPTLEPIEPPSDATPDVPQE